MQSICTSIVQMFYGNTCGHTIATCTVLLYNIKYILSPRYIFINLSLWSILHESRARYRIILARRSRTRSFSSDVSRMGIFAISVLLYFSSLYLQYVIKKGSQTYHAPFVLSFSKLQMCVCVCAV